jgi:3'(2'), 5'-bisphosphate nucleotidase
MHIDDSILIEIARRAGANILTIYQQPFEQSIDYKADSSPLTLADKASHHVINEALAAAYPAIPVLSEEGKDVAFATRQGWKQFWLVDPLDGTKEFIKRNGEFTVNIALIDEGLPVWGIVFAPVLGEVYVGNAVEKKAYKLNDRGERTELKVNERSNDRVAVRSRSHASDEEEALLGELNVTDSISVGSSLKFCMVAEGRADVYYRHGPTMEWDTAAGQAVVEAAGGHVWRWPERQQFRYNKESLLNTGFLVTGFSHAF